LFACKAMPSLPTIHLHIPLHEANHSIAEDPHPLAYYNVQAN